MKNNTTLITFEGKDYKIREIFVKTIGWVNIATTSLNEALFGKGFYSSKEAQSIDEQIFYFVEENQIDLSRSVINELVYEETLL
jgi:predicted membrane protein